MLPSREWVEARKFGQLWYEICDFSTNLSPDICSEYVKKGNEGNEQFIIAMHPHGVIPFHAILWSAFCDQYLKNRETKKELYGFGAAADIVTYLPLLKNVMGYLSASSASYNVLKAGLVHGKSTPVNNNNNRKPRHLYILPGGIAEIFKAKPGRHSIVFKHRKGLCRLSLETGALLIPCYVFGMFSFLLFSSHASRTACTA